MKIKLKNLVAQDLRNPFREISLRSFVSYQMSDKAWVAMPSNIHVQIHRGFIWFVKDNFYENKSSQS